MLRWVLAGLVTVMMGLATQAAETPRKVGDVFRDCPQCPEMVVLPAGMIEIGSDAAERERNDVPPVFGNREGPVHTVTFARPFAMSRYEITRGQYAAYAASARIPDECAAYDPKTDTWPTQSGFSWQNPGFPQTDEHPAVCISWNDATAYAQWLSQKTRKHYRLPSEAEWEYGARAGSRTARYWGDSDTDICTRANVMSRGTQENLGWPKSWQGKLVCSDDRAFTLPVGSFAPNAFGLYDMIGNVWEAIADCYHDTYNGAPADGSAWNEPGCKTHLPRGGGFHSEPWLARAATRGKGDPNYRGVAAGIRIVRELE